MRNLQSRAKPRVLRTAAKLPSEFSVDDTIITILSSFPPIFKTADFNAKYNETRLSGVGTGQNYAYNFWGKNRNGGKRFKYAERHPRLRGWYINKLHPDYKKTKDEQTEITTPDTPKPNTLYFTDTFWDVLRDDKEQFWDKFIEIFKAVDNQTKAQISSVICPFHSFPDYLAKFNDLYPNSPLSGLKVGDKVWHSVMGSILITDADDKWLWCGENGKRARFDRYGYLDGDHNNGHRRLLYKSMRDYMEAMSS